MALGDTEIPSVEMLGDCRPIRLKYFLRIPNVGDRINPTLVSSISGLPVTHYAASDKPHLVAAGSTLAGSNSYSHVWGTGAKHPDIGVGAASAAAYHAVRGKLTYSALRKAGAALGDIPLGDPGFLAPALLGIARSPKPRYMIGVVPHYVDRANTQFRRLVSDDPSIKDLNVHLDPGQLLRDMAECETVISSSLHGLIFAEALGIPNLWVTVGGEIDGGAFKFEDWFSTAANPQHAPHILSAQDNAAALISRASLHECTIDADALLDAFPRNRLQELRETHPRRLISVEQCRTRPLPVFLISFNRGNMLRKAIASSRRMSRKTEIVVHDNGSTAAHTLALLSELEQEGVRIYRRDAISAPDELSRVNDTVREFFAEWAEPARYIVSDCDIDMEIAAPEALDVYDELLNGVRHTESVGPMLRISDIPRSYPLFNWVMNRHIKLFWHRQPSWFETSFGPVAYLDCGVDTTFALHRAGEAFRRHKGALRVYEPYAARHLDWYLDRIGDDAYGESSSKRIAHWNNSTELERHRNDDLQYERYIDVRRGAEGRLEAFEAAILSPPHGPLPDEVTQVAEASMAAPPQRASRLSYIDWLQRTSATDVLRWSDPAQHHDGWSERGWLLAGFVRPRERVFEFGVGCSEIAKHLAEGCAYTGSDVTPLRDGILFYDLNGATLPEIADQDVALLSGVIEYVHDLSRLAQFLSLNFRSLICSYAAATVRTALEIERRRYNGWYHDLTDDEFVNCFRRVGFGITMQGKWKDQILFRFDKVCLTPPP